MNVKQSKTGAFNREGEYGPPSPAPRAPHGGEAWRNDAHRRNPHKNRWSNSPDVERDKNEVDRRTGDSAHQIEWRTVLSTIKPVIIQVNEKACFKYTRVDDDPQGS